MDDTGTQDVDPHDVDPQDDAQVDPHGGDPQVDAQDSDDDELLSLIAGADVPPPIAPAERRPAPVPPTERPQTPVLPAGRPPTPVPPAAPPPARRPHARSAFVAAPPDPVAPVVVGRRFQPIPGGSLPRPSPSDPAVALLLAPPGAWVHAAMPGRVRRAAAQVASGALELHGDDGTVLVLTGTAPVVWAVDDDETVAAGQVIGTVVGARGAPPTDPLTVLAFDSEGRQMDAVAMLVGLPDPGELDLQGDGSFGVDPYRLDLELAGEAP